MLYTDVLYAYIAYVLHRAGSPEPDPDRWTPGAVDMLRRSQKNGGLGWFESPLSLSPPAVVLDEAAGNFIDEVRTIAAESIEDASTHCYVLTGRTFACRSAVSALLATAGLQFADVICKTATDKWKNNEFKKTWLAGLIKRHSPDYVEMWEDDPTIVRFLRSTFGGDRVRIHDVTAFVQCTRTHLAAGVELELVSKLIAAASRSAQDSADVRPSFAYTAVMLDAESKLRCRSMCHDCLGGLPGWSLLGDHMTINLGRMDLALNPTLRPGDAVVLECRSIGWSERAAALHVAKATSDAGRTVISGHAQTIQHVTLGFAPDAQARDANCIKQWTTLGDAIQLHGRVSEVQALVPSDHDAIATQAMLHMMQNHGGDLQGTRRSDVFTQLQGLCEQWQRARGSAESIHLVSVGSFAIGADFAADDIDVVVTTGCVAPSTGTVQSLADFLAVSGADAIRFVTAGSGRRMLCLRLGGVDIDMLFSSLPIPRATALVIESCDAERMATTLASADTFDVPELSSIRDTTSIKLALANLPAAVTLVLRFIKLWATARGISDNKLGYLGGSGWMVMVLQVALEARDDGCRTAPELLRVFFARYAVRATRAIGIAPHTWGAPPASHVARPSAEAIRDLKRTGLVVLTAAPSRADGTHDNIARNSTASTAARVWAELRRAHEYLTDAPAGDESFYRQVGPTMLLPLTKADIRRDFDAVLRVSLHPSASLDTIALLGSRLVQLALQLEADGLAGSSLWVPLPARRLGGKPTMRVAGRFVGQGAVSTVEQLEALAHAWVETTLRGAMDEVDSVELVATSGTNQNVF